MEVLDNILRESSVSENGGNMLDNCRGLWRWFEDDRVACEKCWNKRVDQN